MTVVDALLAVAASDHDAALAAAEAARRDSPDSLLAERLARFLRGAAGAGVYDDPTSFEQFIDGGGNPHLYERTIDALRAVHRRAAPTSVLDIGCGDGRVAAAVVQDPATVVDLVEPSAELLSRAGVAMTAAGCEVSAHQQRIDDFLAGHPDRRWDLAQSTFAMSAVEPATRSAVLRELARRTDHLLVVEFDVPDVADRSEEHARHVVDRYERGVAEYADDPEVIDGFLLPVLVGQFDPSRTRHTFEQSADSWVAQLASAGFATDVRPISDYWWATAVLLEATVSGSRAG